MGYVWNKSFKSFGIKGEPGEELSGEMLEKAQGTLRYLLNKGFLVKAEDYVSEASEESPEELGEAIESEEASEESEESPKRKSRKKRR